MSKGIIPEGRTRWARHRIGYHLVWTPKYRRKILAGDVAACARAAMERAASDHGFKIIAIQSDMDHIHLFVSARPAVAPADIVRILKGVSSRTVRAKYPRIAKVCGKRGLWSQSYYVGTTGDMSAETVRHYIEECQGR